jgi:predicted PurR-regulated permease PerM
MATTALVVLAVLGVLAALHLMQSILVPAALALLLACLLAPLTDLLRRFLPLSATGAAAVLFLFLVVGGLFLAIMAADSLERAAETLPAYTERLAGNLSRQVEELTRSRPYLQHMLPDPGKIDQLGDRNRSLLVDAFSDRLSDLWTWVAAGLVILVLVLFLLAESEMLAPRLIRFATGAPGDARAVERTFQAVVSKLRAYLLAYTLLNAGLGLSVAVSLRLLGVEFPWALGALTAVASFVPYIGQVAVGVLIALLTLSSSGSLGDALLVSAVYAGLVGLTGYVLLPVVIGRSLDLNGTTVLLSCLLWGFLWGLVGLFLAIPITVTLKLLFQHTPRLQRWAELMSRDWRSPVVAAATTEEGGSVRASA